MTHTGAPAVIGAAWYPGMTACDELEGTLRDIESSSRPCTGLPGNHTLPQTPLELCQARCRDGPASERAAAKTQLTHRAGSGPGPCASRRSPGAGLRYRAALSHCPWAAPSWEPSGQRQGPAGVGKRGCPTRWAPARQSPPRRVGLGETARGRCGQLTGSTIREM